MSQPGTTRTKPLAVAVLFILLAVAAVVASRTSQSPTNGGGPPTDYHTQNHRSGLIIEVISSDATIVSALITGGNITLESVYPRAISVKNSIAYLKDWGSYDPKQRSGRLKVTATVEATTNTSRIVCEIWRQGWSTEVDRQVAKLPRDGGGTEVTCTFDVAREG